MAPPKPSKPKNRAPCAVADDRVGFVGVSPPTTPHGGGGRGAPVAAGALPPAAAGTAPSLPPPAPPTARCGPRQGWASSSAGPGPALGGVGLLGGGHTGVAHSAEGPAQPVGGGEREREVHRRLGGAGAWLCHV